MQRGRRLHRTGKAAGRRGVVGQGLRVTAHGGRGVVVVGIELGLCETGSAMVGRELVRVCPGVCLLWGTHDIDKMA